MTAGGLQERVGLVTGGGGGIGRATTLGLQKQRRLDHSTNSKGE